MLTSDTQCAQLTNPGSAVDTVIPLSFSLLWRATICISYTQQKKGYAYVSRMMYNVLIHTVRYVTQLRLSDGIRQVGS